MPSPLEHLYPHIIPALARVAPERARELQRLIDELGVTFVFDDKSPNMVFKSNHANNSIKIGLRALERFWVRANAYIHLYEHITKLQLADVRAREFDLTKDVNLANAMTMLAWAVDVERRLTEAGEHGDPGDVSWPRDFPWPPRNPPRDSLENAADELFLCALAAVLHHEMGHLARKHDPRDLPQRDHSIVNPEEDPAQIKADRISTAREKEADAWSAEWLLEGLDPRDDRFLKRVLGTSLGYLWSATRNIHTGYWLTNNHPPAWDRLYQNLKQYVDTDTHPVWLFAAYILQLHLQGIGEDPAVDEVGSGEEWVNILLDKVSKTNR
jgi:hypothetical protein